MQDTIISTERRGRNTLTLWRLTAENRRRNLAKQLCRYALEYTWHPSETSDDCEVLGQETSLYPDSEMRSVTRGLEAGKTLFDYFNLF